MPKSSCGRGSGRSTGASTGAGRSSAGISSLVSLASRSRKLCISSISSSGKPSNNCLYSSFDNRPLGAGAGAGAIGVLNEDPRNSVSTKRGLFSIGILLLAFGNEGSFAREPIFCKSSTIPLAPVFPL